MIYQWTCHVDAALSPGLRTGKDVFVACLVFNLRPDETVHSIRVTANGHASTSAPHIQADDVVDGAKLGERTAAFAGRLCCGHQACNAAVWLPWPAILPSMNTLSAFCSLPVMLSGMGNPFSPDIRISGIRAFKLQFADRTHTQRPGVVLLLLVGRSLVKTNGTVSYQGWRG